MKTKKRQRGFSLIELLVAMAITLIVLGGVTLGFTRAMGGIQYAFLRTETQANARAAINDITRDLTQAGSGGLPYGGPGIIAGGAAPFFARDLFGTNYLGGNQFVNPVLNPVTPANGDGIIVPGVNAGVASDGIVILYEDSRVDNFPGYNWQNCAPPPPGGPGGCPATIAAAGTSITMPAGITPAINNATVGLQVGDLVMLNNQNGSVVGEVTGVGGPTAFNLAAGDVLGFNNAVGQIANKDGTYPPTTLYKLAMVSYSLQGIDAAGNIIPGGAGAVDYRLYRQVNALPPVPVAEHIVGLLFTYDLANSASPVVETSNVPNAVQGGVPVYNQIWNVYVSVTARSQRTDSKGNYTYATLYTNIAPRNLTFNDRYK